MRKQHLGLPLAESSSESTMMEHLSSSTGMDQLATNLKSASKGVVVDTTLSDNTK